MELMKPYALLCLPFGAILTNCLATMLQANFNDKFDEVRKKWGGGVMGSKSQAKTKARERLIAKEAAQRMT